jgi:hypothetical protein
MEVIERLQLAEAGGLHAAVDLSLLPHQDLILQDQLEELGMVELALRRLLQAHIERHRQPRQMELL